MSAIPAAGKYANYAGREAAQLINKAMLEGSGPLAKVTPQAMGILPPSKYVGRTLEGMPDVVNVGGKLEQFGTD